MTRENEPLDDDGYSAAVRKGIAQADAGALISNEDVGAWVESLATANPLPMPKPERR